MKSKEVTLRPLSADDREQFILDNQWAFKHGALYEFGERNCLICPPDKSGNFLVFRAKIARNTVK